MKKLNKITLILVAVIGMAISGCGSDIKNAPYVVVYSDSEVIRLTYYAPYKPEDFKTWEAYEKKAYEWYVNMKKNPLKLISLKGRRDCSKLSVKYKNDRGRIAIVIEPGKDCPPKNRLDDESYEFTIKTHYGTFKYDTNDTSKSSKYANSYRAIK